MNYTQDKCNFKQHIIIYINFPRVRFIRTGLFSVRNGIIIRIFQSQGNLQGILTCYIGAYFQSYPIHYSIQGHITFVITFSHFYSSEIVFCKLNPCASIGMETGTQGDLHCRYVNTHTVTSQQTKQILIKIRPKDVYVASYPVLSFHC